MISGFWRADIDTCIYCTEALQLCARCWKKKKRVRVKKEKKKAVCIGWKEGLGRKKNKIYIKINNESS